MAKYMKLIDNKPSFFDDEIHLKTVKTGDKKDGSPIWAKESTIPIDAIEISDADHAEFLKNQHMRGFDEKGKLVTIKLPPAPAQKKQKISALIDILIDKGIFTIAELKAELEKNA